MFYASQPAITGNSCKTWRRCIIGRSWGGENVLMLHLPHAEFSELLESCHAMSCPIRSILSSPCWRLGKPKKVRDYLEVVQHVVLYRQPKAEQSPILSCRMKPLSFTVVFLIVNPIASDSSDVQNVFLVIAATGTLYYTVLCGTVPARWRDMGREGLPRDSGCCNHSIWNRYRNGFLAH